MKAYKRWISAVFAAIALVSLASAQVFALDASQTREPGFSGSGTEQDPYLIASADDLFQLAGAVNSGTSFDGEYFLQTEHIDLAGAEWTPIGPFGTEYSFCGIYNGNGHYVENLYIPPTGNNGFFGQLGGTVMNFGIESGDISGACVGAISSHSSRSSALIINCYNKASVSGSRAGGIADNFNGTILNCWTDCPLQASEGGMAGGISSYGATTKNCFTLRDYTATTVVSLPGCTRADGTIAGRRDLSDTLNQSLYSSAKVAGLDASAFNTWTTDENGNIVFSDEHYSFQLSYLPAYLKEYAVFLFPVLLGLLGIVLLTTAMTDVPHRRKALPEK